MTDHDIKAAMDQLARSQRGERAMWAFMDWVSDHATGLDAMNQQAMQILLNATFSSYSMVRRVFEEANR